MGESFMNAALLIVDVQKAIDGPSWGERNNLDAEANIEAKNADQTLGVVDKAFDLWGEIFEKANSEDPGSSDVENDKSDVQEASAAAA